MSVTKNNTIKNIDLRGQAGRCFFTTDIHGHFDLLDDHLKEYKFNTSHDILIIGGDLCDRGPCSDRVLEYLNEPWVYAIRGNHEEMVIGFIEALATEDNREIRPYYINLANNGGEWFLSLGNKKQLQIYESFKSLPIAIELTTEKETIGIVHAEVPDWDWGLFKTMPQAELDWYAGSVCQWGRTAYTRHTPVSAKGVDRVLVGHTPTKSGTIEILGNVWYCDMGAFFRNKLSFIQLN